MLDTATKAPSKPGMTTAEDTLKAKTRDEGVDTIFTLGGGHIIDIYDGCIDEGFRIIDVRHEQIAAHAADKYARQEATGNAMMAAQKAAT